MTQRPCTPPPPPMTPQMPVPPPLGRAGHALRDNVSERLRDVLEYCAKCDVEMPDGPFPFVH